MVHGKKVWVALVLLVGGYIEAHNHGGSVYDNGQDYRKNYFPSQAGGLVLTDDSPQLAQLINNSQVPPTWALNLRKGRSGYINQTVGTAPDIVTAMAMESNGTFVAVGSSSVGGVARSTIGRVLPNGSFDTGFNGTGYLTFDALTGADKLSAVILDGSNTGYYVGASLVTPGASGGALAHITTSGAVDTSFGTGGIFTTAALFRSIAGIARQSSGNIVYTGESTGGAGNFSVARVTSAGVDDTTFTVYTAATMTVTSIAIDSQDRVVVVGGIAGTLYVYRFMPNGGLDTTFNGTGIYTLAGIHGRAVAVLSDDSIVVAGDIAAGTSLRVVKLTSAGALDTNFGGGTGIVASPFTAAATISGAITLLPNGQIAVAARSNSFFACMLLNSDGSFDTQFVIPGQTTTPGTALVQIQAASEAYGIGYQNIADSGLVVLGVTNYTVGISGNLGVVFYTNAALK